MILKRKSKYADNQDECVIVHLSVALVIKIAHLHNIVRENKLLYLACELSNLDSANLVHHLPVYSLGSKAISRLCVSDQELWLECSITNSWGEEQFVTNSIQLKEVIPVDLPTVNVIEISPAYARKTIQPYMERLKALQDADKAYEIISEAVMQMDTAVPNEHLALVESLVGCDKERPFRNARRALEEIESDLETWEKNLELEKAEIFCQALGLTFGEDLVCELNGKSARIRLKGAPLHSADESVYFHLWGKRFRKDGILGKRDEYLVLKIKYLLHPEIP